MSMTSFYGGRQGASINIVKTYDKIKFSDGESPSYRHAYYAINASQKFIYNNGFIEKTSDNFDEYTWQLVELNGQSVACSDNKSHELPTKEQIDMVSDFKKGGETTGIDGVNYGEYVLIDSDNKEDPDNGKIFRRGLDYTNEMGGAEYKGQIVGPRGGNANLKLDHYNVVDREENKQTISYTVTDEDLVSGATHDSIDAVWSQVIDDKGQIVDYLIGFKFPYEVIDFTAEPRSPYDSRGEILPSDTSLIERIPDGVDSEGKPIYKPFYEKWHMQVPRGIKGDSLSNFKTFFSKIAKGSPYYATEENAENKQSSVGILDEDTTIFMDTYFKYHTKNIAQIKMGNPEVTYWVNLENGKDAHFGYLQTDYDHDPNNEHSDWKDVDNVWKDVDKYKVINRLVLQEDGQLRILYTCDEPQDIEQVIRWIWLKSNPSVPGDDGIRMDSQNGIITVYYNTLSNGEDHDSQQVGQLTWVTKIDIELDGTLKIYYNNEVNSAHVPADKWDSTTHCYTSDTQLKWIENIKINTGSDQGGPGEGMGNQKVNVTYNDNSSVDIGNPLNYVVETLVAEDGNPYGAPAYHLLVWYSDPALRATLRTQYYKPNPQPGEVNRIWKYASLKDPSRGVLDDWFDLGYVKGETGGVRILMKIDVTEKETKLYKNGVAVKPEELLTGTPNLDYAGWLVEVSDSAYPKQDHELYAYNYDDTVPVTSGDKWHRIGSLSASLSDVISFLYIGNTDPKDPTSGIVFKDNGLWFHSDTRECVEG